MEGSLTAILWAQWRSLLNFHRRSGAGRNLLPAVALLLWYGLWGALAFTALAVAADPASVDPLRQILPRVLILAVLYWQLAPLVTASLGASLDLKKLLAYPIQGAALFRIEVLLRLTTCAEVMLLVLGAAAGLTFNPALQNRAAPAAFLLFILFNLFVAAGLRNQLERWMERKRMRELLVLVLLLGAALPQLLLVTGVPFPLRRLLTADPGIYWPWTATARLALGDFRLEYAAILVAWTVAAYFFGRWQFARSLRFDAEAVRSMERAASGPVSWLERVSRLPSLALPDPLAATVEKELRSLARTPRFRLVFVMGFTFGVILFLPLMLRNLDEGNPGLPSEALVLVAGYALLLMGDVAFWNVFGFDRGAAQVYFLLPVPFSHVLVGKNMAAAIFVFLELGAIAAIWSLIGMPVTTVKVAEMYAVALTYSLYLLGCGNLSSVYYPRAVNPERSTGGGSAGRMRILLLLVYPVVAIPVLLAYGARYAFGSAVLFYTVLAFAAVLGVVFYKIALDSAVAKAERDRDSVLETLARSEGPLVLS